MQPFGRYLHAQCTNTIGKCDEVYQWGEGNVRETKKKNGISGIHQGFLYINQLLGNNYAIVDAIFCTVRAK